jgi:protein-S-isoprenylcysteine O-methyltransferase Ste14
MLLGFNSPQHSMTPIWLLNEDARWFMALLTAAGLAFCWWARLHLGRLWSASVTRKEGHHIIDTGPYAFVRHPIYTGIILASFATAVERGTAIALAGAAIMTIGWYMKARIEERFLRQELGAAAYDSYAGRVAMLVPFLKL